jgi:hypothetical protein
VFWDATLSIKVGGDTAGSIDGTLLSATHCSTSESSVWAETRFRLEIDAADSVDGLLLI